MLSTLMITLIGYLKEHPRTSYKEIASALNIKERSVRYDIDRINDLLDIRGEANIERLSKGILVVPEHFELEEEAKQNGFTYSTDEREHYELLKLILSSQGLKINPLAREMGVSRTTVKNDLNTLDEHLAPLNLKIHYTNTFIMEGAPEKIASVLLKEVKRFLPLILRPPKTPTRFESSIISLFHEAFPDISFMDIERAVLLMLSKNNMELTDISFTWYVSCVIVFLFLMLRDMPYSFSDPGPLTEIDLSPLLSELERLSQKTIPPWVSPVLLRFLDYTSKGMRDDPSADMIEAESITLRLVNAMSKLTHTDFFLEDNQLIPGLVTHMVPLLERIHYGIELDDKMSVVLSEDKLSELNLIREACKGIAPLNLITSEDEFVYLYVYFLASRRRMRVVPHMRVTLVCGHGYGTTTMLEEKLASAYQIRIVASIPVYKLRDFDFSGTDLVLSTTAIDTDLPVPHIVVNPIPTQDDFNQIEAFGVKKKHLSGSMQALERKIDFLSPEDKMRVLAIVEEEFGYIAPKKLHSEKLVRNLLRYDAIRLVDRAPDWESAVRHAGQILVDQGAVEKDYVENTIKTMKELGFYSVTDDELAVLHGKAGSHVNCTSMSLVVYKEPVQFADKKTNVLFFLSAKEPKAQIPYIISLTRMVRSTPLIESLVGAKSVNEIYQSIVESEISATK